MEKNRGGELLGTQEAMLKVIIENNGWQPRCAPYIRAQKDWANFPPPAAGVSFWALVTEYSHSTHNNGFPQHPSYSKYNSFFFFFLNRRG